jgi:hypothetical protein
MPRTQVSGRQVLDHTLEDADVSSTADIQGFKLEQTGGALLRSAEVPSILGVLAQGTTGVATWTYEIVGVAISGETVASGSASTTEGNDVLDDTNFNRINWSNAIGMKQHKIYRVSGTGSSPTVHGLIGTVTGDIHTFDDIGIVSDGQQPNTTELRWRLATLLNDSSFDGAGLVYHLGQGGNKYWRIFLTRADEFSEEVLKIDSDNNDDGLFTGTINHLIIDAVTDQVQIFHPVQIQHATDPSVILYKDGEPVTSGLWKVSVSGPETVSIIQNLAAEGNFSMAEARLAIDSLGIVVPGAVRLTNGTGPTMINFIAFEAAVDIADDSLFVSSADDERIHWKDGSSVDHGLAYLDEVVITSDYVANEIPSGDINGVNDTFVLANTPGAGTVSVYLNGLLQAPGMTNDYTIVADTITFNTAPLTGDVLLVSYVKQ